MDIFEQINNAVLDLQASQLQTYERPLKSLARLLSDPSLEAINKVLTDGVDLDDFLTANDRSGSGMIGSAKLVWPDDSRKALGLTLLLIKRLAESSDFVFEFSYYYYHSGDKVFSSIQSLIRQLIIPFARDYRAFVLNNGAMKPKMPSRMSKNIFIVHGHDGEARESVARFITSLGLKPIILHEQANRGRTVIEKVEANSDVSFAIVLLTPDDLGKGKDQPELEPRARQNVLLELGYFFGKLGREHVCALKKGDVEIPSDFAGVVWEKMDGGNGWKLALARELQAAGHHIDWNQIMRE